MMFWLLCAILTLVVMAAIVAPLVHARMTKPVSAAAYDLDVYRDQLREVGRDLERGVIGADEAARLKAEIGRKILDADRRLADIAAVRGGGAIGAVAVLALVLAGAVGAYLYLGAPGVSDQPITGRIAAAERSYDLRPNQAEAEAAAQQVTAPQVDAGYAALVAELRKALAKNPDDARGLSLLASSEMRMGNISAAREAQQRLVDLRGAGARPDDLLFLAVLMIDAAGGIITPEAEETLARALKKDPDLPQARYLVGLLQLQNGRPDRAFPIWRNLLEEGPYDAPWALPIRANIRELAWLAGWPDYEPPAADPALPGPDAGAMAAAEELSPEERQQMVESMVAGLEDRLATKGGSPAEWARLITSLAVLGRIERAGVIWAEAQERFGDTPSAIAPVRAAAQRAGLVE